MAGSDGTVALTAGAPSGSDVAWLVAAVPGETPYAARTGSVSDFSVTVPRGTYEVIAGLNRLVVDLRAFPGPSNSHP